ncbi:MAG TPA: DUF2283 domain-containing protein [Candidatus Kapabacteria bacterium]|nr:DUF2283 domain-containing protein [Candidatus Kapabacteria bacterium]
MNDELKFKYSADIDALRIYIQVGQFHDTIEVAPNLFVDFDEHKNILSIEMLDASKLLSALDS